MPTQDDYLTQIDADLEAETEPSEVLLARREAVEKAKTDDKARTVYNDHVRETQAEAEAAAASEAVAASEAESEAAEASS